MGRIVAAFMISNDAPRVWITNQIVGGLADRGVTLDPIDVLRDINDAWINRVRLPKGGCFLTVKHPALLAAIEQEVVQRLQPKPQTRWRRLLSWWLP